jgi:hypothetical protein
MCTIRKNFKRTAFKVESERLKAQGWEAKQDDFDHSIRELYLKITPQGQSCSEFLYLADWLDGHCPACRGSVFAGPGITPQVDR